MIPNISLLNKFAKGALPCAVGYYGKDCVIYSRVSTKEQSENNHSLEWQKSTCEKFAKDNGMNIIEYFGGTYESAKTDERKEFNRMLKFVQKNKNVAYIIVFSLDRFSRTGDNAIYISSQLKKNGVHIVSATQRIDTSTSAGVLHQNIEFVLCNNENNVRRDRSVTGMHEKLKRGEWIGPAPIGYSYDHNAKEQTIYINDKGEHIKQAFIMRSEGVSYPEISKYLINHGIACYKQMLSKLFRNPFYCGYMSHNLLFGEVTKGNHEALISQELFLRVNGKLKKDGFKQKKANVELPLKGFVFDYKTNEKFTGYLVKKKGIYYYKVNKAGVKVNRSQKIMHAAFIDELNKLSIDPRLIPVLRKSIMSCWKATEENLVGTKISFTKRLNAIDEKLEKVMERFALGEINSEVYEPISAKLRTEKSNLEDEIKKHEIELSNPEKAIDFLLQLRSDPSLLWLSGDFYQKQRYQELIFPEGIWFDAENNTYRTKEINSAFLINPLGERSTEEDKKETPHQTDKESPSVPPMGMKSNHSS